MKRLIVCISLVAMCVAANAQFFYWATDYGGVQNDDDYGMTTDAGVNGIAARTFSKSFKASGTNSVIDTERGSAGDTSDQYFGLGSILTSQSVGKHIANNRVTFVPNGNQWEQEVKYQADIHSGRAFFTGSGVTFSYYNTGDLIRIHNEEDNEEAIDQERNAQNAQVQCFAFKVNFSGCSVGKVEGESSADYHVNYFQGNNPSLWASDLPVYNKLKYNDLYPGIDVLYYSAGAELKYDFIVEPGADPSLIAMEYVGLNSIILRENTLFLDLGFTMIKEIIPSVYQIDNGVRREVNCNYALSGNNVHFVFPDGYDSSLVLFIDPTLIASTYSGGVGATRGYCSTYDDAGNIYTAGTCFSTGFPVTLGAYNVVYSSSGDIGISKYNADGSSLLYCTYLGGVGEEYAHSLIVSQGNLYIYGTTFSYDFPVPPQAYDQTLNGICDIYVSCLDNSGSTLLASTLIGGSWSDGVSMIQVYRSDSRRGEIIVAQNGDVLIASGALSQDFPTTPGAYVTSSSGGQDAIVFRMNGTLTNLIWATYLGSGIHDMAFGIREGKDGSVYVCGGANNMFSPFPVVPGCYQSSHMGALDAFVAKLNSSGSSLDACTFYGGTGRDIAYFMDLDKDGDVYIFGESNQSVPVTPGVFSVTGSRNFIAKLNPGLTSLLFSTVIGNGPASNNIGTIGGSPPSSDPHVGIRIPRGGIVPTAFGVDQCKRIYFCGFGSDARWPLTPDALYPFSGDNQFYIGVLEENATDLLCATMYGGYHTDGGMGRFDPNGILYQATCQGASYFPTTPSAFSDGSAAPVWDVCVFKIDMHSELYDSIILPNVFTPNNDGVNDEFVAGFLTANDFDLTIYDRYGVKLFNTTDPFEGWDGMYNGNPCAEGVYYCTLEYVFCTRLKLKKSFVHLKR